MKNFLEITNANFSRIHLCIIQYDHGGRILCTVMAIYVDEEYFLIPYNGERLYLPIIHITYSYVRLVVAL